MRLLPARRQASPFVFAFAFVATVAAAAQAPIPVEKEPRHRTVFADRSLRVLDVTIPFGDTTLAHTHVYDLATICIEGADTRSKAPGEDFGPVRMRAVGSPNVTEYAGKPGTHTVRTVGMGRYRLMAVENLKTSGWSTAADAVVAPATKMVQETRAFRVYEVRLGPDEPQVPHTHAREAVVVVPATASFEVIPAGKPHVLTAARGGNGTFMEIELR
jgi:hypothetical protein